MSANADLGYVEIAGGGVLVEIASGIWVRPAAIEALEPTGYGSIRVLLRGGGSVTALVGGDPSGILQRLEEERP